MSHPLNFACLVSELVKSTGCLIFILAVPIFFCCSYFFSCIHNITCFMFPFCVLMIWFRKYAVCVFTYVCYHLRICNSVFYVCMNKCMYIHTYVFSRAEDRAGNDECRTNSRSARN
jgi:hypothetical protein